MKQKTSLHSLTGLHNGNKPTTKSKTSWRTLKERHRQHRLKERDSKSKRRSRDRSLTTFSEAQRWWELKVETASDSSRALFSGPICPE